MPIDPKTEGTQINLLRAVVDKIPAMVAYWDSNLRCQLANRAYVKWFGVEPEAMIGQDMKTFLGPLFQANLPYIEGALRGEEQLFEREIPDPAGGPPRQSQAHYIPDIVGGVVRGFSVLVADITRRKQAEEALLKVERQLQATERLAAMTTLGAGIAHEINNPLTSVVSNVELSLENLDSSHIDLDLLRTSLSEARDGAKRVRDIVRSMRFLARGDTSKREPVDVNDALERSIGFADNAFRYRARLLRDIAQPGYVDGNATQLAEVFVNLLLNAAQALPEETAERNEIRVSARREAAHVIIEIGDNGCGIPEELQTRIFEPFFTTKAVGGGMGLGLSISSGIVNGFGGTISVRSKVGEGSVFRVVFPSASEAAVFLPRRVEQQPGVAQGESVPVSGRPAGRRRLLVVDDEPTLTNVLERILAKTYDVRVANRGRDALAMLAEDANFDLILCDLMMPELSGEDVYIEATRKSPKLTRRFIFMTGGTFTPRGRQFLATVQAPILEKPFTPSAVRAALEEAERARANR